VDGFVRTVDAFRSECWTGSDQNGGRHQIRTPGRLPSESAPKLTGDQKRDLERLISGGYVGPTESHAGSAYMLTAKGIEFLGKRGAGLNEA
jgi:hypothetical protein